MNREYTIEQMAETRWFYTFKGTNNKGEKLIIELSKCTNPGGGHALPVLWKQHGFIDRVLETYWSIETYVKDTEGNCYGRYNPQHKLSDDNKRLVINFDLMFEATEENKEKLIDEVYRLFSVATGETATQAKIRKVREFAEKHNVEVVTEIPNGWKETESMTAPIGSTWVSNMESFKSKNRKRVLLLV